MVTERLSTAVLTLTTDATGFIGGLNKAAGSLESFEKDGLKKFGASLMETGKALGQLGALAGAGIAAVGTAIATLGIRGSEIAGVSQAFEQLSASVGQSGAEMLKMSGTATKGLIKDLDLMKAANQAVLLGLPVTADSMALLGKTAITLGRAVGQDATKSMNDLITALGRSSSEILDNLGLTVKVGEANEVYAKKLGKTAEQLTDTEKKTAFYELTMEKARAKVEELGDANLTFGERVAQGKVALQNFADQLSVAIATAPGLNAGMAKAGEAIAEAFGTDQSARIRTIAGMVDRVAIVIIDVAKVALTGADIIGRAWSALQLIFTGVMSVVFSVGTAFTTIVATAAELAAKIPGVGGAFDGVAASARDTANMVRGMQESFHDQAQEALAGVQGNSAFHDTLDRVRGTLTNVKSAMVSAKATTAELTTTHRDATGAAGAHGSATESLGTSMTKLGKASTEARAALAEQGKALQKFFDDQTTAARRAYETEVELATNLQKHKEQMLAAADAIANQYLARELEGYKAAQAQAAEAFKKSQDEETAYRKLQSEIANELGLAQMEAERVRLEGSKTNWRDAVSDISKSLGELGSIGGKVIGDLARGMGTVVSSISAAEKSWKGFGDGMKDMTSGGGLKQVLGGFASMVGGIGGIVSAASAAVQAVMAIGSAIAGAFRSDETKYVNKPRDSFFDQYGGYSGMAAAMVEAGLDGNQADALISRLYAADDKGKFDSAQAAIIDVIGGQRFAKGGLVMGPTMGLVGERGPEVIYPLDRFERMMRGTGEGQEIRVVLECEGLTLAETMVRHMPRALSYAGVR